MLSEADRTLLLHLLELSTAGPLEVGRAGPRPRLWKAQHSYAEAAAGLGFRVLSHEPPAPESLYGEQVPRAVVRAAQDDPGFLSDQPSLVLALGPDLPQADTIMFNVHLDTVAGMEPASFDGTRFHGRGAIDAKGPAVALLAGIRAAVAANPMLAVTTRILIQAVAGEEGGAMGVFGTRPLVQRGHYGRINLFCEPTGMRLLPRCTAAMTASVQIEGEGSIDDNPEAGHNATVLLGHIAQHLAEVLPGHAPDGRVCVAGIHTGHLHNRVYGTGQLMLNMSYGSAETARRLADAFETQVGIAVRDFSARLRTHPDLARTAADARAITSIHWHKRGLPALTPSADEFADEVLGHLPVWPADKPAFTCDAIWMAGRADAYTAVLGPGELDRNNAHADGEYADEAELVDFASAISDILSRFAARATTRTTAGRGTKWPK